jgi:hypothetical protein
VDAFDVAAPATQACQPWGGVFGTADVEVRDGALTITPTSIPGSFGGCDSDIEHPIALSAGGIFVEAVAVTPTGHNRAGLGLDGGQVRIVLSTFQGRLRLSDVTTNEVASLPYDPVAMRWWRLRPDRMAQRTIAEYAADGYHWSRLGEVDGRPDSVIVELGAGLESDAVIDDSSAVTRFDHLDVCPPR